MTKKKKIIDPTAWISVGDDDNDVNTMPWEIMHRTEHLLVRKQLKKMET